jgi:TatA/E family protein of Tat protein translocase
MDFLGMGWGEILLILVVALLLWGPGKVIEISRSLGKTVSAFKKALNEVTVQASRELEEQKRQTPPNNDEKNFIK